ncbi:Glycosylphosphatidylinositol:protein transamidase, GAA1 component [Sporormia fimetaria CBS 119925]|uniref:Glycosylphosphatidylinositol:protein transamidase, GAA1 component n=1 Tax=Sporormia fimetaria CBS 119925 TaxID=1340428 RepID=A0A6A6VSJ5_9PLEO|nr:Glycosylphosphatidylinositol:protein transamidase, GAA1 component [Sporormia fimetaria CBS 119925]
MALIATVLALRSHPRIQRLPPYLSLLCIIIGVAWLLLLPLNEYSRETYISENALLPGQVHTYFTGSEHNVFRAYRHEVADMILQPPDVRSKRLEDIFHSNNLKAATQRYTYHTPGREIKDENVYAVLRGPRADATEAIVLVAAWRNMDGKINHSGVALVLTLARYFKRWSLWSKDIIFLISGDSTSGPQAWVDAYHDAHSPETVESLSIKSGALQGAVALDYPAGPWGHRYGKLHIMYDGVNGQLTNLDLFNTAVNIASGQMGIGTALQRMWSHKNTYQDRLQTMLRGMMSQGLGHASGPHSAFIPYRVDAITLQTVGDGWHDEMSLGRTVESIFRSLNNLLEHLHQSFFFYLLLSAKRFVSIGTYLPSAMLIAANFSITAIALWVQSGRSDLDEPAAPSKTPASSEKKTESEFFQPTTEKKMTLIHSGPSATLIPTTLLTTTERPLLYPTLFITAIHTTGLIPLYFFNNAHSTHLPLILNTTLATTPLLPLLISLALSKTSLRPTIRHITLIQCFSLLLLGMFLASLATLNFSLSFLIGVLACPLSFVRPRPGSKVQSAGLYLLLSLLNPVVVGRAATVYWGADAVEVLLKAAEGWHVWGLWTQVIVWLVWWPAWVVGGVVASQGLVA